MASPVLASLALGLLALRAGAIDLESAARRPKFMECPKFDGHLVKCRDALMSTPELNDIDLNPDSPEHQAAYDMCLLSKLGVTMRETMVWCEHKGSLLPITDGLIVKIIDEFQVCLEKGEGPVVALRERPSKVSFGKIPPYSDHSMRDEDEYAGYKERKTMYNSYAEEDNSGKGANSYQYAKEKSREYGSDGESQTVDSMDNYEDLGIGNSPMTSYRHRKRGEPLGMDYANMPPSYFYPRKEHGLGNETTVDAAKQATASKPFGVKTTTHPAKQESKPARKP